MIKKRLKKIRRSVFSDGERDHSKLPLTGLAHVIIHHWFVSFSQIENSELLIKIKKNNNNIVNLTRPKFLVK